MTIYCNTTTLSEEDALNDLREVRVEITRINKTFRRTVFNPAATDALESVMAWIKEKDQ